MTTASTAECQINIWYINFADTWVTTDKDGVFSFWDLLNHKIVSSYSIFGEASNISNTINTINSNSYAGQDESSSDLLASKMVKYNKRSKKEDTAGKLRGESLSNINNVSMARTKERSSAQNELKSRLDVVHYLLDITEISYIKLVALSSTDKYIRIWELSDLRKPRVVFSLHMPKGGVHQVRFSETYHVLLIAGYENSIPVFNITPKYLDVNVVGRLVGHVSIITAIELIEGTPMVMTADDTGCIKTWDIRLCSCHQTIDLSNKTSICQLVSLENLNRIAFIGCRVNFLEFDKFDRNYKIEAKQLIPIKAELNLVEEELIVCTNSDVRFLDVHTGRLKKIYAHMIDQEQPDEISVFTLMQKNHKFLLADPKGDMYTFNYSNGERINKLVSQSLEITDVKVDNYNKLIISSSTDSSIVIQRERVEDPLTTKIKLPDDDDTTDPTKKGYTSDMVKRLREKHAKGQTRVTSEAEKDTTVKKAQNHQKYEVLRTINNAHGKNEILRMAVSVYHNLMASASFDNCVFLYDYEFGKFLTLIKFPVGTQITALEFINGLGVMLVCTNDSYCYLIEIANKETRSEFKAVAYIDLTKTAQPMGQVSSLNESRTPMNKSTDSSANFVRRPIPSNKSIPEIVERPTSYGQNILVSLSLKGDNKDLENFKKAQTIPSEPDLVTLNQCELYFTLQNGYISLYNLTDYCAQKKIIKHSNTRLNYNPTRTNTEDCSSMTSEIRGALSLGPEKLKSLTCLDRNLKRNFFAHTGGSTSIGLISIPEDYLMTTGKDKYIKIFSKQGDCLCAWNVNHPLPLKWNIHVDTLQDMKNKILFALKVIQSIFKRYYNMLYIEGKIFDLKGFIKQYKELDDAEQADTIFQLTQLPSEDAVPHTRVMADEYMAKDFAVGKLKELYRQELIGPSVKQLEAKRRLIIAQEEWKEDEKRSKAFGKKFAQLSEDKKPQKMYLDTLMQADDDLYDELKKSDKVRRLYNEFVSIDHEVANIKTIPNLEERGLAMQRLLSDTTSLKKPQLKDEEKRAVMINTTQRMMNYKETQRQKEDFFELAKKRNLIESKPTEVTKQLLSQTSGSSEVEGTFLSKKFSPVIADFSEEARIQRRQKATRETQQERMEFSKAIASINKNLRTVQFNGLNSRNLSLPQIKSNANGFSLDQSGLTDTKSKLLTMNGNFFTKKKSAYNLLKA